MISISLDRDGEQVEGTRALFFSLLVLGVILSVLGIFTDSVYIRAGLAHHTQRQCCWEAGGSHGDWNASDTFHLVSPPGLPSLLPPGAPC